MTMLFAHELFLICPHVQQSIIDVIYKHGGEVTKHYSKEVTYGLVGQCCIVSGNHSDNQCNDSSTTYSFDNSTVKQTTQQIEENNTEKSDNTSTNTTSTLSSFTASDNAGHSKFNCTLCKAFPYFQSTRANRVFILHEEYITLCTAASIKLAVNELDTCVIVYHPLLFHNVEFTTTQLPRTIKENVIAALQFMGAVYSPHLTMNTSLLIYSRLLKCNSILESELLHKINKKTSTDSGKTSINNWKNVENDHDNESKLPVHNKLLVALQRGILCTTPSWVQECVRAGQFQPLSAQHHNQKSKASTRGNAANAMILQESSKTTVYTLQLDQKQQEQQNQSSISHSDTNKDERELEKVVNKLLKQPLPSSRYKQS